MARLVRMFDGLRISTEDWPLIVMEFPEHLLPDAALKDGLSYLEQLLREAKSSGERSYTISDLTRMRQLAPASQRKLVADWMSNTVPLQKGVSLGGANVTPSTILRGLVTAIYWFVPSPVPAIFVATRRDAYAAALKAFDEANVPLRPDVRGVLQTRK